MVMLEAQAALTSATILNQNELLSPEDYVTRAAGLEKSGLTVVEVLVDPTGKPQTCGVASSSGSKDLDLKACAAAVLRGKFTPAADENNEKMHGILRLRVRWILTNVFDGPSGKPQSPPDISFEVAKLPEARKSVQVALTYLVNEQGAIERCSVLQSSGIQAFDASACSTMKKLCRFAPAKDKADKPWPVVRMQRVEFTTSQAPSRDTPSAPLRRR
jgi:TonB family protein